MSQLAVEARQQKDNLCGPYCAARILGVEQDLVALRAGTRLPASTAEPSVPRGARSLTDYRYELPKAPDRESGTSAAGLIRAIESLSEMRCVPIRGDWTADRVASLVDRAPALGARLIANIRTGRLWGSRPTAEQILAELRGDPTGTAPQAEWDTGHFVELNALARVMGGSLVIVHDTYPSLGLGGYHLQPPRAVAEALMRGDGREGGVLAVAPPEQAATVIELARGLGLEIGAWDNGSRS